MAEQALARVSSRGRGTDRTSQAADTAARGFGSAALVTLLVGAFLPILSFFIVNVALPSIGADLHASAVSLELVVGSYGIANACLVVVGGRLGDAFGRRRLFVVGLVGFALFSLLCALAPTIGVLLAVRVGQGASAALMTPQVLATIAHSLTGADRARAVGLFGAVGGVAAALGQILGGVLVSADLAGTGWRSVFLLNVPIALAAVVAAGRLVPETRSAAGRLPLDLTGAGLLGVVLVTLLVPVSEGRALGWPAWTWGALVAVLPLAALLGGHQSRAERRGRVPLVPPSVLALPGLRVGLLIAALFFTGFGGFMFAFSLALQGGVPGAAGLSALQCGLALLPFAAGFLLASVAGPRIEARVGARVITLGSAVEVVGFVVLAATAATVWPDVTALRLAPAMLLAGVGQGLVMMPLFGVVLRSVPVSQAGLGSGILITTQQTALALGAAVVGTAFLALTGAYGVGTGFVLVCAGLAVSALAVLALSLRLGRDA